MRKLILILFIIISFAHLYAKRTEPIEVPSVQIGSIEFKVNHFYVNKWRKQNGGIIEVINLKSNTVIDIIIVYKTRYIPFIEKDAQDVFIKSIKRNGNHLIIKDEKNRTYKVNIAKYLAYGS